MCYIPPSSLQNDLSNTCLDRGDDGIARGVVGEDTRRYKEMGQAPPDHNKTTRYLDRFDCVPRNAYFIELADTGDAFLLERDLPDYVRLTVFPNLSADEALHQKMLCPYKEENAGPERDISSKCAIGRPACPIRGEYKQANSDCHHARYEE